MTIKAPAGNKLYISYPLYETVTIASSGTTTAAVDLKNKVLLGYQLPGTMTSTSMTYHASSTVGGTYTVMRKAGADFADPILASKWVVLDPADFAGVRFLKLVAGSAEGAERSIILAYRALV